MIMTAATRIVAHFDLDAFYVGCERELNPSVLLGVPVAVSQYNPYGRLRETSAGEVDRRLIVRPGKPVDGDTNGSLIAVSYEARAGGVKRNDRGRDAVSKCPTLRIVQVPVRHGKADLTMYRDASFRVLKKLVQSIKHNALSKEAAAKIKVEKASIDEIYIDLTTVATELAGRVIDERNQLGKKRRRPLESEQEDDESPCSIFWQEILHKYGAATCTTVGGIEEVNANALAANALSKDELRRGSAVQVADSSAASLDPGSLSWWNRNLDCWTDLEIELACGASLAARARADVASYFAASVDDGARKCETFTLSAGVSTNKILSKLASGMKKPNRQTVINPDDDSLQKLFHPLPVGRIQGLGGKFGIDVCEKLGVETVGDLAKVPLADIERHYPPSPDNEMAQYLFNVSRGICSDEVSDRTLAKSIGCGKTFRNQLALDPRNEQEVQKWASELCAELTERLEVDRRENLRTAKLFGVAVNMGKKRSSSKSTSAPHKYEKYAKTATKLIRQILGTSQSKIEGLTVFASGFIEIADEQSSIMAAFSRAKSSNEGTKKLVAGKLSQHHQKERKRSLKSMWSHQENINDVNDANGKAGDATDEIGCSTGTATSNTTTSDMYVNFAGLPDDGSIDPYVFSQLPPLIQDEIRKSHATPANKIMCLSKPEEKKNDVSWWLSKAARRKQMSKAASICSASEASTPFNPPTVDEIDQDTLAELPPDIREAVMKDMAAANAQSPLRSNQRLGNKRKRIDNFFLKK